MRNLRTLVIGASAAALLATTAGTAVALPPGGADTVDTAGTAITLESNEIPADNCVVSFTITGWAPGGKASGKFDDGLVPGATPDQQFNAVKFEGIADDKGVVKGSMDCSEYKFEVGTKHWLRFLANVKDEEGKSKKYSLRGASDFTIVEPKKQDDNDQTKPGDDNKKPGDNNNGSGGGSGIAIIIAIVLALLGAAGAALSGAIPGLPRP